MILFRYFRYYKDSTKTYKTLFLKYLMKSEGKNKKIQQEQIHDLLFNREIGWQDIIYDLINTEQLDPWNIDLVLLTDKYLEKIHEIEETDFFVSSKVLLAAALLLKIKSEILLNKYIKSIDEILFGKKPTIYQIDKIELDEFEEIPELIPKSPIPRFRKVTLKELIESLNKAINTENRRIKKEIIDHSINEASFQLPKRKINIRNKIREIYRRLFNHFRRNKEKKKISYTKFIGKDKEERAISFFPLLHLEEQKKIWLEQEIPLDEIYIWLKENYLRHNPNFFEDLKKEMEEKT